MKFKPANVQIWFLDEDLCRSAEYLCDAALDKSVEGCVAALVDARLYAGGVRSKRAYQYCFSAERRQDTMDRLFPGWPFRGQPQMKYYTSRASRWTRQCREHAAYVLDYLCALLAERTSRGHRPHRLQAFADWAAEAGVAESLPSSGRSSVVLPWKSLKTRFRRRDIVEGYRLQYMDTFLWQDPIGAYGSSDRDVPDFVIRHFGLDSASMVT